MENLYYTIIIFAIIIEYLLSSVGSFLDLRNITPEIPKDFQDAYDEDKYSKSQEYLKARTKFSLFSSTFSLILIMVVIHTGIFGNLNEFVNAQTDQYILQGLLFIAIIYFIPSPNFLT